MDFPSFPNLGRCYSKAGAVLLWTATKIFKEFFLIILKIFTFQENAYHLPKHFQGLLRFPKFSQKFSQIYWANKICAVAPPKNRGWSEAIPRSKLKFQTVCEESMETINCLIIFLLSERFFIALAIYSGIFETFMNYYSTNLFECSKHSTKHCDFGQLATPKI